MPQCYSDLARVDGYAAIYGLFDPRTGALRYIGQSINPRARLAAHCTDSRTQSPHLKAWIRLLRQSSRRPTMIILEWVPAGDIGEAECGYIARARLAGFDLANKSDGGLAPNLGRKASEETRAKMSAARFGRIRSLETNAKTSVGLRGHTVSAETREKLRAANLGRAMSPESSLKKSAATRGRPKSEEWKIKMSTLKRGLVISVEQRARISATLKARNAAGRGQGNRVEVTA